MDEEETPTLGKLENQPDSIQIASPEAYPQIIQVRPSLNSEKKAKPLRMYC